MKREKGMQTFDSRTRHFIKMVRVLNLPHSIKATNILLREMNKEKGFVRHDGSDYYVHPIAVAQTAIDFKVISTLIARGDVSIADEILTSCLLHDIVEDVEGYSKELLSELFTKTIADIVDNVTKRPKSMGEPMESYLNRVSSHPISALVKILDRLNNTATLANSSLAHRKRQLEETRTYYLPLVEKYRTSYWEFGDLFYQAKTIMEALLAEIERSVNSEEKLNSLTKEN